MTRTNTHTPQALAEASLTEARRRKRIDLAGDIYCRALHESRDGRRANYTTQHAVRLAAGHVIQDIKRKAAQIPTIGGNALQAINRMDYAAALSDEFNHTLNRSIHSLEDSLSFAQEASDAINRRQSAAQLQATCNRAAARRNRPEIPQHDQSRVYNGAHTATADTQPLYSRVSRLAELNRMLRRAS